MRKNARKPPSGTCAVCLLRIPPEISFTVPVGCEINLNEPLYSGV